MEHTGQRGTEMSAFGFQLSKQPFQDMDYPIPVEVDSNLYLGSLSNLSHSV